MLGLPLIYEMVLVVTLACLITWLMGRTLCKSREHEERAAKQSLQTANEQLEALLAKKEAGTHQLAEQLKTARQDMTALQQQHKTTANLLKTLQQEHQTSLTSIQELTAYRVQFEELSKIHDHQARQVVNLQEHLTQTQGEMAQAAALSEEQRVVLHNTIEQLRQEKQDAETQIAEQQASLATYLQQQQILASKASNQDELIAQLREKNAELQETNDKQRGIIDALNEKVNHYLQSVNSTNHRISSMLETFPHPQ